MKIIETSTATFKPYHLVIENKADHERLISAFEAARGWPVSMKEAERTWAANILVMLRQRG